MGTLVFPLSLLSCLGTSRLMLESRLSTPFWRSTAISKGLSQAKPTLLCSMAWPRLARLLVTTWEGLLLLLTMTTMMLISLALNLKKRITEERLAAYNKKKEGKAKVIAKTSVLLDVKPWADDTDLDEMLKLVKGIEMDGLLWGASKQVPIGYGIKKLTVMCTVEDDKVSVDELQEKIEGFEDHVQSVDVAAMNKI